MKVILLVGTLFAVGCAPAFRYVPHSGKTPEARMCEMQAERARDYCTRTAGSCDGDAVSTSNQRCQRCWHEFVEAYTTCGGSVDTVCVKNCGKVVDQKLANETRD